MLGFSRVGAQTCQLSPEPQAITWSRPWECSARASAVALVSNTRPGHRGHRGDSLYHTPGVMSPRSAMPTQRHYSTDAIHEWVCRQAATTVVPRQAPGAIPSQPPRLGCAVTPAAVRFGARRPGRQHPRTPPRRASAVTPATPESRRSGRAPVRRALLARRARHRASGSSPDPAFTAVPPARAMPPGSGGPVGVAGRTVRLGWWNPASAASSPRGARPSWPR